MENAVVIYKSGVVHFENYEEILESAKELAEKVKNVVVTEETIKASKKMLAEINKKVNELEDGRKDIKKEILAPYDEFEKKVKEIVNTVKDADSIVRGQVKELEEIERQVKYESIVELWKKRISRYPDLIDLFTYLDFIKPQHCNKTTAFSKVESEMAEFIEQRQKSVEMIKGLDHADDILVEFVRCGDVVRAIQTVRDRNQLKEQVTGKKETKQTNVTVTIVINRNDLAPVESFMKTLNINYKLN